MKGLLLLFCGVFVCVQGRVGDKCHHETECGAGECCQVLSPYPAVSRRQLEPIRLDLNQGTCQLYKTENATCGSLEKLNGYCGCGPGLRCHGEEVKLAVAHPLSRRSMIAPRPGYTWEFKCTKIAK